MITAIVFIKADVARIPEIAQQIAAIDGVSEVYSVTGDIDLIALLRVRHHDDVAALVPDQLNKVPGDPLDRDAHRVPDVLPATTSKRRSPSALRNRSASHPRMQPRRDAARQDSLAASAKQFADGQRCGARPRRRAWLGGTGVDGLGRARGQRQPLGDGSVAAS